MEKRVVFLFSFVLVFSISMVFAEEIDISTIDENAVLEVTGGITPDSAFYFLDEFFDNFADAVKVRQEKVAEIRVMIEAGQYEDALEALESYKRHAEEFEREVSPDQRDEARRSAAAIYNVLKSLEAQIPNEYKDDFDDVIEQEEGIVTAAEIAGKIKELCEELSELDPLQYSRVCKTDDDSPEWQQRLHRDLTEEQRQEAEEFFEIMLECFETSGGTCRCGDISITAFADKCSVIAPLAYACEVEGDENACMQMDEIEDEEPIEDLLPDYLHDVLDEIERRFEDERFEHYAPRECEGITDRAECEELIFRAHAPPECVEELFEVRGLEFNRDYGIGEAERDCEEIMFGLYAPPECIDEGITDFRECGKLMFRLNSPKECIDAGLTGEHRGDERKCALIMKEKGGPGGFGPPALGVRCRGIEDSSERLACYDSALSGVEFEHFGNLEVPEEHEFPGPCQEAGAFTIESCKQVMGAFFQSQQQEFFGQPIPQPTFPSIVPEPTPNTTTTTVTNTTITNTTTIITNTS